SGDEGTPLGALVARRLGLSHRQAEAAIQSGQVYVGGRRVRTPGRILALGEKVTVFDPPAEVGPLPPGGVHILYVDAWVLVVDKPSGVPVSATRASAAHALDEHLRRELGGYLGVLHRLDEAASGVLLFSRDPRANASLHQQFAKHTAQRRYLALVCGQGLP